MAHGVAHMQALRQKILHLNNHMSTKLYKLQFEMVNPIGPGSKFYNHGRPVCPPAEIPDEFWTSITRETTDPWQQHQTLRSWVEGGKHLLRNVRLFRMTATPEWVVVED